MLKEIMNTAEDKMSKALLALKKDLASLKAGRANPAMLDKIEAEYYGTMTPLSQLANISVPEARILQIQPWDKSSLKAIEKAILVSDLGLNPNNDGTIIRLIIPELTEETRRNIVKTVKKYGEDTKIAIRSVRRDGNDKIKDLKSDMSEDDIKKAEEEIQKITDNYVKKVDEMIDIKEKEIMSI
ncbi:ribosome-recycling factor [Clostridium tetani]|uniref:Ribosome-recycling factor n=2 Tax=Clostridium tetani TaxID=1513 RepID=RRF_CLOTE|nr:ribosome recycling factor [Clostridium tetani]Q895K9.1 RecName: Full=Ribosome-recycling factor; Short=RRF; AltName: Full=Ribosome-releasing factor [Clostridium tetani E88]AAO35831.1 ribosome recycling factor [Clostridium tetani E88]AVP53724.1 ribosome-recycling factor [Clostridium tetani]KGI38267.1 ribosome recycling factor [Clostridium tetani]KGI40143.1 ribosome recycling factor [Clostridium tetani ATCC 9441]KGI41782.1 ribosome recycling factor [Clostridium tetani]